MTRYHFLDRLRRAMRHLLAFLVTIPFLRQYHTRQLFIVFAAKSKEELIVFKLIEVSLGRIVVCGIVVCLTFKFIGRG